MKDINKQGNADETVAGKPSASKRKRTLIIILAALVVVLGAAAAWAFIDQPLSEQDIARLMETGVFHDNIRINGVDVGGLTAPQAKEKIEKEKNASAATFELAFQLDEKESDITGSEIKATTDIDDVLKKAMLLEKSGSNWQKLSANNTLNDKGYDYTITVSADPDALKEQVDALAKENTTEPEEPAFTGVDSGGKPIFSEGRVGYVVDSAALLTTVQERFEKQDFSTIQMTAQKIEPETTAEELRNNTVLIGEYTTTYTGSSNRRFNVEKAAGKLNGAIVMPGETFDMNQRLGPRTSATGWKDANGIIGGNRYQLEPGGGVCQVSTTLFNAVMFADLEIVERWNHSLRSHYVPPGRDATISTGGKNFRFKNTRSVPVYIYASAKNSKCIVRLYGPAHPQGYTVQVTNVTTGTIKAQTITKADSTKPVGYRQLDPGYESQDGCTANTYVTYFKDGKQVGERKLLFTSKYNAVPFVYIVGTKPVETAAATPKKTAATAKPVTTPKTTPKASAPKTTAPAVTPTS